MKRQCELIPFRPRPVLQLWNFRVCRHKWHARSSLLTAPAASRVGAVFGDDGLRRTLPPRGGGRHIRVKPARPPLT